jgi:hypothetical protein
MVFSSLEITLTVWWNWDNFIVIKIKFIFTIPHTCNDPLLLTNDFTTLGFNKKSRCDVEILSYFINLLNFYFIIHYYYYFNDNDNLICLNELPKWTGYKGC